MTTYYSDTCREMRTMPIIFSNWLQLTKRDLTHLVLLAGRQPWSHIKQRQNWKQEAKQESIPFYTASGFLFLQKYHSFGFLKPFHVSRAEYDVQKPMRESRPALHLQDHPMAIRATNQEAIDFTFAGADIWIWIPSSSQPLFVRAQPPWNGRMLPMIWLIFAPGLAITRKHKEPSFPTLYQPLARAGA